MLSVVLVSLLLAAVGSIAMGMEPLDRLLTDGQTLERQSVLNEFHMRM